MENLNKLTDIELLDEADLRCSSSQKIAEREIEALEINGEILRRLKTQLTYKGL